MTAALKGAPIFQAYEARFPGTIQKAVERAWSVKEKGGSDEAVFADVCEKNHCNSIDVIGSLSKFKKLGLKIELPVRKPRTPKAKPVKQGARKAGQHTVVN